MQRVDALLQRLCLREPATHLVALARQLVSLLLCVGQVGLGIVRLVLDRPVLAPVGEELLGGRLEDGALPCAEPVFGEVLVHVLGDRVQTEVAFGRLAFDGEVDLRVGGARCERTGVPMLTAKSCPVCRFAQRSPVLSNPADSS